ncbi:hypothetical protein ABK040_008707 [Willaertia magna]
MNREHGEHEASTKGAKGTLHNIKEKVEHPFRHDMKTNSTYEIYFIPSNLVGSEVIPQFYSSFPSLFLKMCNEVAKRYGEQFLLNSQHFTLINISDQQNSDQQTVTAVLITQQLGENPKTVDTDYLMQNIIERYARAWSSEERKQIRANLDRMVELNENVLENDKNETDLEVIIELYQRVMSYPEKPKCQ